MAHFSPISIVAFDADELSTGPLQPTVARLSQPPGERWRRILEDLLQDASSQMLAARPLIRNDLIVFRASHADERLRKEMTALVAVANERVDWILRTAPRDRHR